MKHTVVHRGIVSAINSQAIEAHHGAQPRINHHAVSDEEESSRSSSEYTSDESDES